ncbi:MAG: hypothetical protein KDA32_00755 [Phycisphaerales bacterium]|nr:hypothetical protein [Phycisphaerales bacterium]
MNLRNAIAMSGVVLLLMTGCASTPRAVGRDKPRVVQAGCGMCVFHMKGEDECQLAVKIDGRPYLVVGTDIDDYGDAHAPDGLCNTSREARVSGEIRNDRFVAHTFELEPMEIDE